MDNENRNDLIPEENTATEPEQEIISAADALCENGSAEENAPEETSAEIQDENMQENAADEPACDAQDELKAGEYHYTGAQVNQQWEQSSQPSWQQPPSQNNGSQQPPFWQNNSYNPNGGYQNNGYQQGSSYNPNGYNPNGYNPNGYNPNGYNPNGYQQNGYQPSYNNGFNPPPKKKSKGMRVFIGLIIAIVVLSIVLISVIFSGDDSKPQVNPPEGASNAIQQDKPDTDNVSDIQASEGSIDAGEAVTVAQIAKPFNVGILVYKNNSLYTEGSGVIVKEDDDGKYTYIVTCAHVVNHSGVALSVLLEDGTEYQADLVGMDTRTDLAVVRVEEAGLPVAEIASSESLVVGQTVYAVGNPGGSEFFGSVTNGIISAIARPVSSSTGYEMECIQHTSAINPGNSGGALVNGSGQLIGINSMKIASTEYEGMGFSVPSDVVVDVFNSIIENGYVAGRAKLGISYTTPSAYSQTYAMYVQMKGLPSGTIVIAEIAADSDLADKDVKAGDMIIGVNGKSMTSTDMLSEMIEDMSAGDTLTLTIVRVNTENWTQTEMNVRVSLVEDRGTTAPASEESKDDSSSQDPFSGSQGSGGYSDWYDYYKDYFGY